MPGLTGFRIAAVLLVLALTFSAGQVLASNLERITFYVT